MNNKLELKNVNQLCQNSFFIPAYQRGYRWTKQEVIDLLDDINEFQPREITNSDEKTWYCLQPIVTKVKEQNRYEVIDGQQRLTTIYLILYHFNLDLIVDRREKIFEIDFETRTGSKEFLQNPNIELKESNIDYYHIFNAFKAIDEWFQKKNDLGSFDKAAFKSKFKFHTRVIWYESTEEDSISVFTRLNIGKIGLTNSELIKALFLNSSNYAKVEATRKKHRQLEIATEWDNIENALQDNKIWYFINGSNIKDNRIEYIFDLISSETNKSDAYATFRFFSNRVNPRTQEVVDNIWKEIKNYFQRFSEWYNEREIYHKIGFIICAEITNLKKLFEKSNSTKKHEFIGFLNKLIVDKFKRTKLLELQYGDSDVKSVLLLYNIITMLQNNKDDSYFPFETYKLGKWDVEHITSVKDAMPENNKDEWLRDVEPYIDVSEKSGKSLLPRIEKCDINNNEMFAKLYEDILAHFESYMEDNDVNDIENLALLSAETNRSYKNAVFPLKRKTIIECDKNGDFVPLCTKNVFLKYFSDYPPKISFWTQDDRKKYEEDLLKVLSNYVEA